MCARVHAYTSLLQMKLIETLLTVLVVFEVETCVLEFMPICLCYR